MKANKIINFIHSFQSLSQSGGFLVQIYSLFVFQLSEELLGLPTLDERISHIVDKHLLPLGHFSDRKQLFVAAESFYNKLVIADKYKPGKKLQSGVTLIKAANSTSEQSHSLGDEYGLSEVINTLTFYCRNICNSMVNKVCSANTLKCMICTCTVTIQSPL